MKFSKKNQKQKLIQKPQLRKQLYLTLVKIKMLNKKNDIE